MARKDSFLQRRTKSRYYLLVVMYTKEVRGRRFDRTDHVPFDRARTERAIWSGQWGIPRETVRNRSVVLDFVALFPGSTLHLRFCIKTIKREGGYDAYSTCPN